MAERGNREIAGEVSLIGLLKDVKKDASGDTGLVSSKPLFTEDLQDILREKSGVELPDELVGFFGFHLTHWEVKQRAEGDMPFLALGRKAPGRVTIDNATASFEIAYHPHDRLPMFVRMSAIDRETNERIPRVVGMTFDREVDYLLTKASFSLSMDEGSGLQKYVTSGQDVVTFSEAPTDLLHPYLSAGLFTPEMFTQTSDLTSGLGGKHGGVVHLNFNGLPPTFSYSYEMPLLGDDISTRVRRELELPSAPELTVERVDEELLISINPRNGFDYYGLAIPEKLTR